MEGYGEISTITELEAFIARVGGFHDGVIKEMHWVNHDFIRPDLSMMSNRGACARILIQRQWENPSAVELRLFEILRITLDTRDFVFDSNGTSEPNGFLVLQIEDSEFVFRKMRYRFVSDWLGNDLRFGSDLPWEPPALGDYFRWDRTPKE